MRASWLWARREIRARWRSLVVLGVIAGVATGVVVAALAGARRTGTAFDRFRDETSAPDAIVFGTQVQLTDPSYDRVLALPEVVDGGEFALAPMELAGVGTLPPADTRLYRALARPLVLRGRLPRPDRVDEIAVNRAFVKARGVGLGDRLTLTTSNDLMAFFGASPMEGGPTIETTVVGVVGDSMMELIFSDGDAQPGFVPSGAVLERYGERIMSLERTAVSRGRIPLFTNLVVRLRPGTDVGEFHRRAAAALGAPDVPVRDLGEDRKRVVHATDLERTGLVAFAAAAALAAVVLVGQALARTVAALGDSGLSLRAVGFRRRDLVGGALLAVAPVAAVAVASAIAVAYGLSSRFPLGLAARLDPERGRSLDGPVTAAGGLAVVVLLAGATAVITARVAGRRSAVTTRPSRVAAAIRRRAPLPLAIGAGQALEPGAGARQVPVRPALAGAVAGVLGVVGALGLVRGIDDALANPMRAGQAWDATVYTEAGDVDVAARAAREDAVADVSRYRRVPVDVGGAGVPVYSVERLRGDLDFVVLDGRRPLSDDEVAVAPSTAKALDIAIGDRVAVRGARTRTFAVVGTALLPQTAHSSFDQGAWVTAASLLHLAPEASDDPTETGALVRWRSDAAGERAATSLAREGLGVEGASQPQDVELLRNVRGLPRALGAFLVLLALAAVGHVLATSVRRRRGDFAVLRALGWRRRQVASCVRWQATTVGVIGLLLGLPLGVTAGRLAWRWMADRTPLVYVGPVAGVAVLVAVPAAILLANALGALPARRAARLRAVEVLRAE